MRYRLHTFRATETIDAVIKLLGRHNYTAEEMIPLRREFDKLNGAVVPRPGMTYRIPLPFVAVDDFGDTVDVTPPPELVDDETIGTD